MAHCPFDGTVLISVEDPLLGRTIAGRYRIEECLGRGGMGAVYRGLHQVIDRPVAIKFLHARFAKDGTQRRRFLGEARAANQINHENIIDVTDYGETEDGHVYLVMEYLRGRCLSDEIGGRRLAPMRALRIARQVALGLARAHELDVIHRDVKPDNVFLLRRPKNPDFVKLLDFGIAHFERELRITDQGSVVGTPEYMSPEQLRSGALGPATDLYALGCVLFEMLTGAPPFYGTPSTVMIKQVTKAAPSPSELCSEVPKALDAVVLQLLQKSPEKRYRDAHHLIEDLERLEREVPGLVGTASDAPTATSSIPARGESPTLHVPSEEHDWRKRVAMYRQLLATAYPEGTCPHELSACLARMQRILDEVIDMRTELDRLAKDANSEATETRSVRDSILHALDELARDDSTLARSLEGQSRELRQLEAKLDRVCERIASLGRTAQKPGAAGSEPPAASLELVEAAEELAAVREVIGTLRAKQGAQQHQRDDLEFQISQLKGRLASTNAESHVHIDRSGGRANELEDRIRSHLERLVPEATTLADRMRGHPAFGRIFRG
ncbi:MAG: protein kinase [Myxococcales bacterium]|nr:protein kinase [Myxococcales bacterium]